MEAIKVTLLVPPKNDAFEKVVFRVLSTRPRTARGFAEHGCTESLLLADSVEKIDHRFHGRKARA